MTLTMQQLQRLLLAVGKLDTQDEEEAFAQEERAECFTPVRARELVLDASRWTDRERAHREACSHCDRMIALYAKEVAHLSSWLLVRRAMGVLSPEERQVVERHLGVDACESCLRRAERFESVTARSRELVVCFSDAVDLRNPAAGAAAGKRPDVNADWLQTLSSPMVRAAAVLSPAAQDQALETTATVGVALEIDRLASNMAPGDSLGLSAIRAVEKLGPKAATPTTLQRLVELCIQRAVGALAPAARDKTRETPKPVIDPRETEYLASIMEPNNPLRLSAIRAVEKLGTAAATPGILQRLVERLGDEDAAVRASAALALGAMPAQAAELGIHKILDEMTRDDSEEVRLAAACAIRTIEQPRIWRPFVDRGLEVQLVEHPGESNVLLEIRTKNKDFRRRLLVCAFRGKETSEGLRDRPASQTFLHFLVLRQEKRWLVARRRFDAQQLHNDLDGECRDLTVFPTDVEDLTEEECDALRESVRQDRDDDRARTAWEDWLAMVQNAPSPVHRRQTVADLLRDLARLIRRGGTRGSARP